jgi:hypothetical protein
VQIPEYPTTSDRSDSTEYTIQNNKYLTPVGGQFYRKTMDKNAGLISKYKLDYQKWFRLILPGF